MRILILHNHYGAMAPSGENYVFNQERDLLLRKGHEVHTLETYSDHIRALGKWGLIAAALSTPWNASAASKTQHAVATFRPDVVHVHNTFPMLSPAIFPAAQGAARVLTLHNYRLQCAAAIPMRDGEPCTLCIDRQSVGPALRYGCYRDSRLATLPIAAGIALHRARGTWKSDVERFIALSKFQKDLMARGGLPDERIEVKPNFLPGRPEQVPFEDRQLQVVFIGRISAEKGVLDLIQAWRLWGEGAPRLLIVGDGPMRSRLQAENADLPTVHFTGQLTAPEVGDQIARSRLLLLPSRWYETFGMTILEAFSRGVAVGVSRLGPLPDLVAPARGLVFAPGDSADLHRTVAAAWADQMGLAERGRLAHAVFKQSYSESANYDRLMEIYDRAIYTATRGKRLRSL